MELKKLLEKQLGVKVEKQTGSDDYYGLKLFNEIDSDAEYLVGDVDTAYKAAINNVKDFIEIEGIEYFTENFKDNILQGYVKLDELDDLVEEDIRSQAYNMSEEELKQNLDDLDDYRIKDLKNKEELVEEYVSSLFQAYEYDMVDYFVDILGSKDEVLKWLYENDLLEIDDICETAVKIDGVAHFLASYDSKEIDLGDDFVAYRVN